MAAAAKALGMLGDARAVQPLIKLLERSDGRKEAAVSLGQIGDKSAIVPLRHALVDNNKNVRRAVAEALGQLGEPVWKEYVTGEGDDLLRLGRMGDEGTMLLIDALERDDFRSRKGYCRAWRTWR